MKNELESVLELQSKDLEIFEHETLLALIPAKVVASEASIKEAHEKIKQIEEAHKEQMLAKKKIEGDVESKQEQLQKYEMQLNAIKTNEAYKTMLKEIDGVKSEIRKLEDQLLEWMEVEEHSDSVMREQKQVVSNDISKEEDVIRKHQDVAVTLKRELKKHLDERNALTSHLSGTLLNRYEKYYGRKKTRILVPLRPSGSCSGCSHNLPPNVKNDVMKGRLEQCDSCGRLLYWEARLNDGGVENPVTTEEEADLSH
jgi:predicted  nucleic acid-binding Zn-ribbon protein